MKTEVRNCQNCRGSFTIEPEDFTFYEKMNVPPPTWCPQCRLERRLTFRPSGRIFYRRECGLCHKKMLSIYDPKKPFPVYCTECWWGDGWSPVDYAMDYDPSQPFLVQLKELFTKVPVPGLHNRTSKNCEYCDGVTGCKDCYMLLGGYFAENCHYGESVIASKNSVDSDLLYKSDRSYWTVSCTGLYNTAYSRFCEECLDSAFLFDCKGSSYCFGSINLRSQKYRIFNEQYSKESYQKEILKWDLGGYKNVQEAKRKFDELYKKTPHRYAFNTNTSGECVGDNLNRTKNCHECYGTRDGVENCKYVVIAGLMLKDSYDTYAAGEKSDLLYEVTGSIRSHKALFGDRVNGVQNVAYSRGSYHSSDLFGCTGLRNKKYCILNKQYSETEYEELKAQIIEDMRVKPYVDAMGREYRYGEYFPSEMSFFSYNESVAQQRFPLTKREAHEKGFSWRDPDERSYSATMKSEALPDHIKDVRDSITKEIIACPNNGNEVRMCTTAYRILPQELAFYRTMNLPLPRMCPNCRFYERLQKENPYHTWRRQCRCAGGESEEGRYKNTREHFHGADHCPNEFQTPYSPSCEEIIYCESCYQSEVT